MNKSLLVLASLMVAGAAMGADDCGTFTFKTYFSGNNNLQVVRADGKLIESPCWYMAVVDAATLSPLQGTLGPTCVAPCVDVISPFRNELTVALNGFVTSGGDWAFCGIDQGATINIKFAAFYDCNANWLSGVFKTYSDTYTVTLGGSDLVPPVPPGRVTFAGHETMTVIPEPFVPAPALLGLGAFWIRRRR